jgi:hypothetical protein
MERGGVASQREGALRRCRIAAPALVVMLAVAMSGCASISQKFAETASQLPAVGLPAGAPERPSEPTPFPAVHDIPPPRNSVTLTNMEQQRLEEDLVAARDHQQSGAGVPLQSTIKKKKQAQQPVVPVSSRASIY